jgi:hypothetical protein
MMSVDVIGKIKCMEAIHTDHQNMLHGVARLGNCAFPCTDWQRGQKERGGQHESQKSFCKVHFKSSWNFTNRETLAKKEIWRVNKK